MRLLETPYCLLDFDPERSLVRFTRNDVPYTTLEDIEKEAERVEQALARIGHHRLLVDLRSAAPRNDPGFEVAVARLRKVLFSGSARSAILVRTAIGALQTKRHARQDGVAAEVFDDEASALTYVERTSTAPPSSYRRRGR